MSSNLIRLQKVVCKKAPVIIKFWLAAAIGKEWDIPACPRAICICPPPPKENTLWFGITLSPGNGWAPGAED